MAGLAVAAVLCSCGDADAAASEGDNDAAGDASIDVTEAESAALDCVAGAEDDYRRAQEDLAEALNIRDAGGGYAATYLRFAGEAHVAASKTRSDCWPLIDDLSAADGRWGELLASERELADALDELGQWLTDADSARAGWDEELHQLIILLYERHTTFKQSLESLVDAR